MKGKIKVENLLVFLFGLLCTLTAVAIPMGSTFLSLYNILFPILFIYILIKHFLSYKPLFYIDLDQKILYLFFISLIISSLISCVTLPPLWYTNAIKMTIKFVILAGGIIFFLSRSEIIEAKKYFFRGLYCAAYLQLLWGILQVFFWNLYNLNINELIFGEIMHIQGDGFSWSQNIMGGIICRMSGFSWEPASFAFMMLIGWILSNNKVEKIIFVLAILASTSRTGILTLFILLFVKVCVHFKENGVRVSISVKHLIYAFIFVGVSIACIWNYYDQFTYIIDMASFTIDGIITGITTADNDSANTHKLYYFELFNLLSQSDWYNILFGYGTFCAGYAFHVARIVMYGLDTAWNPESDFITIFVSNGIIGGLLYYTYMTKVFFYQCKARYKYLTLMLFCFGITYGILRGTIVFIILIFLSYNRYQLQSNKDKNS